MRKSLIYLFSHLIIKLTTFFIYIDKAIHIAGYIAVAELFQQFCYWCVMVKVSFYLFTGFYTCSPTIL